MVVEGEEMERSRLTQDTSELGVNRTCSWCKKKRGLKVDFSYLFEQLDGGGAI